MEDTDKFIPIKGQSFHNQAEWVAKASTALTGHPLFNDVAHGASGYRGEHFKALCFDQKGRRCTCGADFQRAEDDNSYPVWYIWPDQISYLLMGNRDERQRLEDSSRARRYTG